MASSIFDDKSIKPDNSSLCKAIGETAELWTGLRQYLEDNYGPLTEDWKFYNKKSGWILKLLKKKRNLFFFTPSEKYFKISFVFGDKAVAVVEKSDLPKNIIDELLNARKYVEGRGLSLEIKQPSDVENVKKLVVIKVNN